MTRQIVSHVPDYLPWPRGEGLQALHYVLATVNAAQTLEGADAFDTVDVERLFSTVAMLAERRTHEASPFVSWDPAIEHLDRADPPRSKEVEDALAEALLGSANNLSGALTNFIDSRLERGNGRLFRQVQIAMTRALRQLLRVDNQADVRYLAPIVEHSRSGPVLTVATLNYDQTIETMARSLGVPCDTGIESWSRTGQWSPPAAGVSLLKLHGSIDWVFESAGPILPARTVRVVEDPSNEVSRDPAIVFGERNKLTAVGPFLELLAGFQAALRNANQLIIVGYSFRDDHINETVRRWINGMESRTLVVIDPSFPVVIGSFDAPSFKSELVGRLPQPHRLRVIPKNAREGLAELLTTDRPASD